MRTSTALSASVGAILVSASLAQWARPVLAAEREAPAHGIAGMVKDEAGHPLAGAWVTEVNTTTASRPRKTVVTNESGHYVIPDLPGPGPYDIRVRIYGYADRWLKNVSAGAAADINYGPEAGSLDLRLRRGVEQRKPVLGWILGSHLVVVER